MSSEYLDSLKDAVIHMKFDQTESLTRQCAQAGFSAVDILNRALLPALEEVGRMFREGDYFLPDVLMSVKAYNGSYNLLKDELKASDHTTQGTVLLGTVEGDIHEIGKNILAALLHGNGFTVVDLGVQVSPATFLERANEVQPDIIGMSSLLTTTMPAMKETIDLFSENGVRDRYKFIIGGSPVTKRFADDIGADGYGEDAQAGVELARRLLS